MAKGFMKYLVLVGVILLIACALFMLLATKALALTLAPGECITDANSTVVYCAQNVTQDFNSTCVLPIYSNISSELSAIYSALAANSNNSISQISNFTDNCTILFNSYNEQIDANMQTINNSLSTFLSEGNCSGSLFVCERRLDDALDKYSTEAQSHVVCKSNYAKLNTSSYSCVDASVCNNRVKQAQENLYLYAGVAFVGGIGLMYYMKGKGRHPRKSIETHEPIRGEF